MFNYLKLNWKSIFNILAFVATLILFFYIIKLSFVYAAPIYFAILFFILYKPLIRFLNKRGLSYKISVTLSITIFSMIVLILFASLGTVLFFQSQNVIQNFPQWIKWGEDALNTYIGSIKSQMNEIPSSVIDNVEKQLGSIFGSIGDWSYTVINTIFSNVSVITKLVIQIVLGYILSIFLAFEWPSIQKFLSKNIPGSVKNFTTSVFGDALKGISSFLKAQLILITATFLIVWVSLTIIGVDNALFLAFLSGIFDILPLLGVATLFVPWIIYLFITGNAALAIKLTIVWLIVLVFRQVMEPRITGDSLGISPFLMLAGMLICTTLLGFVGIILSPVILVIIKSLWEKGYFHFWLSDNKIEKISTS